VAWFKGDDKAHCNAKLRAAQLDGVGLHFMATSWCSDEETDGFVPEHMLPSLAAGYSTAAIKKIVLRLTTVQPGQERPAWHIEPGGYRINDYLEYNPSHAELHKKREDEKRRLADKRARAKAERDAQRDEMLASTFDQHDEWLEEG
jgi:hypothetical protein